MEIFRYRLQTLLDQKLQRKQEAERHLAACRQKLRETEQQLADCTGKQHSLEALRAERRRALLANESGGAEVRRKVDDLALFMRRIEEVKDELMSLRLQVEESKENVDRAASRLAAAAREVEVLNKHRDRGERRFRAELDRKDAIAQDETASALFAIRRRQ